VLTDGDADGSASGGNADGDADTGADTCPNGHFFCPVENPAASDDALRCYDCYTASEEADR